MATSKAQSLPSGIIKVTKLLEHLNKPPKLTFTNNVKSLRLSLAYTNDHWGARHFVKEDLPRIRHHNPDLEIDVIKWRKEKNERWRPELEVKFENGLVKVVDMDAKPSSAILNELMSIAGGIPWKTHVEEARDDEKPMKHAAQRKEGKVLPNLWEFRKANPLKEKKMELARKEREERKAQKKNGDVGKQKSTMTEETPDTSEVKPILPTTHSPSDASTTAAATI